MTGKVRRHRVLGSYAGLVFGLGVALLIMVFGLAALNLVTVGIIAAGFALLGAVLASVTPARAPK